MGIKKMRTINACLVIMMTIFGLTNAFDFASIREIQSLKQNSFAASLIETISLSLSSSKGNGVAEVLKMLQDLKTQLTTDQTNDDRVYAAKNEEFNTHIKKLDAAITLLNTQIAALEARIQVLTGLIAQAKINIQSFTDRIDNLKQSIVDIDAKLKEDTKYYTTRAAGLQEMVGSVSGVGIKGHIAQTEAEKRDIAWSKAHAKSFIQLSKTIPMVASKLAGTFIQADQKALQRLMGIIAKFAQQALDERQEALDKLDDAIAKHKELRAQMVEEIRLNKVSRAKRQKNLQDYEAEKSAKEQEKKEKQKEETLLF